MHDFYYEASFYSKVNTTDLHMKSFVLSLAFMMRLKTTLHWKLVFQHLYVAGLEKNYPLLTSKKCK